MKNVEKTKLTNSDLIFNLKANLEVLEKQITRTQIQSTKSVKSTKKVSPKNGDIVKGKVYSRKDDLKRDTTEELVRKYKSKRYASKKTEIYETLKKRRINYEKRKVKDAACKKRMKVIDDLIVEIELFDV